MWGETIAGMMTGCCVAPGNNLSNTRGSRRPSLSGFCLRRGSEGSGPGVGKSLLRVKLLLTRSENESGAAIAASYVFVGVAHGMHSFK